MNQSIEEQFKALAAEWKRETGYSSSTTDRMTHPAYQKIIGLGPDVIPLLLRDMQDNYTHWFHALHVLTGEDPTDPSHPGNVPLLVEEWVKWGYERGYLK